MLLPLPRPNCSHHCVSVPPFPTSLPPSLTHAFPTPPPRLSLPSAPQVLKKYTFLFKQENEAAGPPDGSPEAADLQVRPCIAPI